ncbi:nuclear transport factor 2-like isoform X1 [Trifolium pratense]|uniref:nuclear transport factor 2-like isoform X1 n=1 Tax=Trifolium pratense TaxID=57577 RepID=UPI001E695212|nr:nuclear transport factor 2-like isoform X1 [Trifolium pratense]XP_045794605.1 nuclear transport factor 2-like isoform X1 [Trifolium pratense]
MALQTATPPTTPSAEMVGNAFVEQYYHILHQSPELVYRFYQESSVISRPDSNGVMTSVTTMKGINEKILSLNYKEFKAEIKTADAQKSHKDGVTVLVTGCLTGKDNLRRKFAQSFFLAPQDNGFFVLNDVFRYVEDREPLEPHTVNGVDDAIAVIVTSEPEPIHIADPSPPDPANSHKERQIVAENAYEPSNHHETQIVAENEDIVEPDFQSNENDDSQAAEITSSSQEDAPKKSYASIVKVPKGKLAPAKVYVPTNTVKKATNRTESQVVESVKAAPVPESAPDSVGNPESNDSNDEVEGHSIYIRNLPLNVTVAQLETEFKKFGPIKPGGIQVRNNKQQGYCFGFVEYLSLNSMNNAIQASPIAIGGRQAVIEIKRTTARVGSGTGGGIGRGRIPSGRPGFRNDSFRGRGNFSGGRGYGRNNDHGNRGEFSIRGRGPGGHAESYHQGRGRGGGRSNAFKQSAVPSE